MAAQPTNPAGDPALPHAAAPQPDGDEASAASPTEDDDDRAGVDDSDDDESADDGAEVAEDDAAGGESESLGEGADDGFWIQVASLRLKEKAERMAARLRKRGHDARASAYGGPRAGWWHVVRIGPYVTRLEAETARLAFVRQESMPSEVQPRAHGPYYIQVASLRSEARAKTQAARLRRLGHNAVVRAATSKTGPWYCVRVGPFDFETDVLGYQKILEERDGVKGEITPRVSEPEPASEPASEPESESD